MKKNERILQIEDPDTEAVASFLDVRGRDGFVVTVTRRKDMGVDIRVRQSGPRGSSAYRDTDFSVDPFDPGEMGDFVICDACGEFAEVNERGVCEGCCDDEQIADAMLDPAGSDDYDAPEGA